jgi:septin family protein
MKLGMTILVLFKLALLVTDIQGHGSREMDDETYDVIVKALRGEFCIPVKERTRVQRAALVRLWRNISCVA